MKSIVYLNGEYIEESEAKVSIHDRGFMWGDAVYDVARTFRHVPFRLDEHVDRLYRSLGYAQIDPCMSPREMHDISLEVIKRNKSNWASNDDYLIGQTISRGESIGFHIDPTATGKPTVLIHCRRIAFESFAKRYTEGIHLIQSPVRRIPSQCLDPRVKVRSRMVNVLADLEVKAIDPSAFALMLDVNGSLSEGTSFNFFIVKEDQLLTPSGADVLEGVTRRIILRLAAGIGLEARETDLTPYDLHTADEVFVTATSFEILPVSKVDHKLLKGPFPGPVSSRLLAALSDETGVDIVAQAMTHLQQPVGPT